MIEQQAKSSSSLREGIPERSEGSPEPSGSSCQSVCLYRAPDRAALGFASCTSVERCERDETTAPRRPGRSASTTVGILLRLANPVEVRKCFLDVGTRPWLNAPTMPTQNTDHAIRTRIDSFLAELSGLVRKAALDSVEEVLSSGAAPRRRRGPGRPKGSGRRGPGRPRKAGRRARRAVARAGRRVRRSAADLAAIASRVMAQVRSKQGQRVEEIGRALRTDTGVLKKPIADLLKARKLKTKGQKRGTRYFVR